MIWPGAGWVDLHKLAEIRIPSTLKENGLVQGDVESKMENHLGAVFMAHGLGHCLGPDAHDTSGYPAATERLSAPVLKSLRTARILEKAVAISVEPSCYFIEALLIPALQDSGKIQPVVEGFRGCGDVRLEDDVRNGCEISPFVRPKSRMLRLS